MKRFLLMAAAVTAMLTACEKTEMVPTGDAQEISFVAVNKNVTKVPVAHTNFLSEDNMAVAAYIVAGTTPANFFKYTLFEQESGATNWTGQPARYWPLTTSTINFLAVTETGGKIDKTTVKFDETNYAYSAEITLSNNTEWSQNDLMFAAGQGTHTQGGAYNAVPMVFKHALAWINFNVKTTTPTTGCTIKVNSITLNSAVFNGTLKLTNNQYNTTGTVSTDNISAVWTAGGAESLKVPNAAGGGAAEAVTLNADYQLFGNGLLVVPDGYAGSFTINYTLTQSDNTANTYDYTYNLPVGGSWEMAKKYFYNINIDLTEIEVAPEVDSWETEGMTASLK